MGENPSPFQRLVAHIAKPLSQVAAEADLSLSSAYRLWNGEPGGAFVWRKLSARYGLEIRQLGLTAEDFLAGQVLAGPV